MKRIITLSLCLAAFITTSAQWNPTTMRGEKIKPNSSSKSYYSLDIKQLKSTLSNAEETGKGAKPVVISLPTLEGKVEKFAVYSFPVMVKSLADRYDLGSYVGVGIDDPGKYVRFSVAPNDFQSMIIKNGVYQFIEPQNKDKSVYGVHEKTTITGSKPFICGTSENTISKKQMDALYESGKNFANVPTDFSKNSDKKFRTMRLAMSVTGEYTTYFGGVAGAVAQIQATITRVNGVFENEFGLHLILQDFPTLIYTDSTTDPYSPASTGAQGAWNTELQNTLTSVIGNSAYDIGHLFGATGGGGNAGCIGCVCVDDTALLTDKNKGSGFTSPADAIPKGDNFDIDYVAHEMGHQLGGNHTFSFQLESGTGVNVEPGSGSTIMGYAGITGATNDVQPHSDPYFSVTSLIQIQANLIDKTCDVEVATANNAPVIAALTDVTIPKGTAFVLTASATDAEGNPFTYCWEEVDNASVAISNANLGNTTTGASFRSLNPTASGVRYFPKLSTVLAGNTKNIADWEAVSTVARASKFRVTVRDNGGSTPGYQQTENALQNVTVGNDGPFRITSTKIYTNGGPFTWDAVNTAAAPYNSPNVKIDYTVDNGANWIVVSASTPNDGSENLTFATLATGAAAKIRVSSIGNVFYAIKNVTAAVLPNCDGTPPTNLVASNITSSGVTLSWDAVSNATYVLQYRVVGTTPWTTVNTANISTVITGLDDSVAYEAQIAAVCSGTTGTFSASTNFTTLGIVYCPATGGSSADEYISNVTVTPVGAAVLNNTSGQAPYSNFANDPTKVVNLVKGSVNNSISITKTWTATKYNEAVVVWIDFNRDGVYTVAEKVMSTVADQTTPVTATFSVPADAYSGSKTVGMRVMMRYNTIPTNPCTSYSFGEIEDYAVKISANLATGENTKENSFQVYPNPATDILNVTKVNNKAVYSIYNVAGQIVSKGNVKENKVQVSNLVKGVYIISIENNGETSKVKFIKK
ncbi:reprolysin-like metallopeptidase [Halpernia frigidisoli]|uniref:Por secretion system C-terminal sorting domain-containing protein n=1 Tax=Halpernia frigidisoli TaxID=1125876 RepID=A0A1I3GRB0_9FLAO|nr:zinc-dependent metalloprotease family protein [Halpernia frigidisoli]SFI25872.1 Por secretion system C-terminal sorting domain-containing protein [Halpernia frigidisoli]